MGKNTKIEWVRNDDGSRGVTWNPVTGCDRVSPACDHCYALTLAPRLKAMQAAQGVPNPRYAKDGDPVTSGPGFGLTMHEDLLALPLRKTRPTTFFVNSMSDLFHKDVSDEFIAKVFAVMAASPAHTFQVLTKRHGRMRALLNSPGFRDQVAGLGPWLQQTMPQRRDLPGEVAAWPLPNVWLGVSAENQHWADLRIPALLATPAALRFVSLEPLLGPVDLRPWTDPLRSLVAGREHRLDWVIVGGESGPRNQDIRPMHSDWVREIRDTCVLTGVPFMFKQFGNWVPTREKDPRYNMDSDVRGGYWSYEGTWAAFTIPEVYRSPDWVIEVGKHEAGRELDGKVWDQMPRSGSHEGP